MSMTSVTKTIVIVGAFPEEVSFIKGGVQASVYGLAKSLSARKDIELVHVIALPVKGSSAVGTRLVDGLNVSYFKAHRFQALDILHLRKIVREIRVVDAWPVHVHGTGLLQAALVAVMRLEYRKCIWTLHGLTSKETLQRFRAEKTFPNLLRHALYATLEWFLLSVSKHIIVDTPYVAQQVPVSNKISVIPQGIFTEEFAGLASERKAPVILSVGVISPRKGHHKTIEAFAKVKAQYPDARLIIAGAVADAEYYERLKKLAGRGVELRVDVPREQILKFFAEAKIFALHSEEESQGIALCEAMAAGLPVVASNVGGIPYVVSDKQDGLLTPFGNTDAFADAMLTLLKDDALYDKMSAEAKASSQRFDWKNIVEGVITIYQKT